MLLAQKNDDLSQFVFYLLNNFFDSSFYLQINPDVCVFQQFSQENIEQTKE